MYAIGYKHIFSNTQNVLCFKLYEYLFSYSNYNTICIFNPEGPLKLFYSVPGLFKQSDVSMSRKLSAAEVEAARECFAIYSSKHKLSRENLGKALRSVGANPSNQDLQRIMDEMRLPDSLTFEDFLVSARVYCQFV